MIFVTGGAGYIGSHTCLELLNTGFSVTVFDNLSNSSRESMRRVEKITGKKINWIEGDIRDPDALLAALRESQATAVIHFAGLKAVGESVEKPLLYYDNNVVGTVQLLQAMEQCNIRTLVFSSSATVYGQPQRLPLTEDHSLSATNPYGRSKLFIEGILRDLAQSNDAWRIGILRYFNPVGSHSSGMIGEDPQGRPNNLMPYIAQVAAGKLEFLNIWGSDYATADGTGVRDYIHVVDLAQGHIKALTKLQKTHGCLTVNLGTGVGYSVLDMVHAFEQACGKPIPYKIGPRRAGDVAACYADPAHALSLLGWRASHNLQAMCADTWRWQSQNPNGYAGA